MKSKTKDLAPKSPSKVKGGGYSLNANIAFVHGAKPKVTGKDLPPKSPTKIKGGGVDLQDNITLVRVA